MPTATALPKSRLEPKGLTVKKMATTEELTTVAKAIHDEVKDAILTGIKSLVSEAVTEALQPCLDAAVKRLRSEANQVVNQELRNAEMDLVGRASKMLRGEFEARIDAGRDQLKGSIKSLQNDIVVQARDKFDEAGQEFVQKAMEKVGEEFDVKMLAAEKAWEERTAEALAVKAWEERTTVAMAEMRESYQASLDGLKSLIVALPAPAAMMAAMQDNLEKSLASVVEAVRSLPPSQVIVGDKAFQVHLPKADPIVVNFPKGSIKVAVPDKAFQVNVEPKIVVQPPIKRTVREKSVINYDEVTRRPKSIDKETTEE